MCYYVRYAEIERVPAPYMQGFDKQQFPFVHIILHWECFGTPFSFGCPLLKGAGRTTIISQSAHFVK